ncbi:MAG: lipopolysaccharide biosynthesis protein [Caulobacterales bacterium]|nr:lipopolysaccharide biosynthesis protein [Caulobacterales bacterium]
MTSIGQKIARGAAWSAVETWGRQAVMFLVFALLARLLGPEAYGLIALSMVAPLVLAVPVTKGVPEALIQRRDIDDIHLDSAFWTLVGAGAALTAAIWASAGMIAAAFHEPILEQTVRWTSLVVFIQAIAAVPGAVLKRALKFRLFALRTLLGTVSGGVVGVTMALAGCGVWSLVGLQLTKVTLEMLVLVLAGAWRPRLRFSAARARELLAFAAPVTGRATVILAKDQIPNVVLGIFLGPAAVGIYALARRLYEMLVEAVLSPIVNITMPAISRLQGDAPKIDQFFDTVARLAALAAFPAFAGLAAVAPLAVPVVFGEQWSAAAPVVQIIMVLGAARALDSLCGATLTALGHAASAFWFTLAGALLSAVFTAIGAQFGVAAATAGFVAASLILLPVYVPFTGRTAGVDIARPLAIYPALAAATGLMALAVTLILRAAPAEAPAVLVLAGGVATGALVYGAAVFAMMRPAVLDARDALLRLRSRAA